MSDPRRHHYVPQFHLAGFTSDGTKDGLLYVTDLKRKKQWQCKPGGVAHSRDFYRVDIPGVDPFAIERGMADLEGEMATVLKEILETQTLPTSDSFTLLMHLVAFSLGRVPAMRKSLEPPAVRVAERVLDLTLASPDRYYSTQEDMKRAGKDVSGFPCYEEAKAAHERGGFIITTSQNWNVHSGLMISDTALPMLFDRNWSLVAPENPSDILICSDNPVSLSWTSEEMKRFPPGFGMKNTMVYMPLSSYLGLVGVFEQVVPYKELNSQRIAALNRVSIKHTDLQIFSRDGTFKVTGPGQGIRDFAL